MQKSVQSLLHDAISQPIKLPKGMPPLENLSKIAECLIADKAIQDFYEINPKHHWGAAKDFDSIVPTALLTWIEAKAPTYIKSSETGLDKWDDNRWRRIGAVVTKLPVEIISLMPGSSKFPREFISQVKTLISLQIFVDHPWEFEHVNIGHIQHYCTVFYGLNKKDFPVCLESDQITLVVQPGAVFEVLDQNQIIEAFGKQDTQDQISYLTFPIMSCINFANKNTTKRVKETIHSDIFYRLRF